MTRLHLNPYKADKQTRWKLIIATAIIVCSLTLLASTIFCIFFSSSSISQKCIYILHFSCARVEKLMMTIFIFVYCKIFLKYIFTHAVYCIFKNCFPHLNLSAIKMIRKHIHLLLQSHNTSWIDSSVFSSLLAFLHLHLSCTQFNELSAIYVINCWQSCVSIIDFTHVNHQFFFFHSLYILKSWWWASLFLNIQIVRCAG